MDNLVALIELFGYTQNSRNPWEVMWHFVELIAQVPDLPLDRLIIAEVRAGGPFNVAALDKFARAHVNPECPSQIKTVRITRFDGKFDGSEPSLDVLVEFLCSQGINVVVIDGLVYKL